MTDRDAVADWVGGYLKAWDSNEPDDIRALFIPDAEYRFRPTDEPTVGHDAIVGRWLDAADEPGDHSFSWRIVAVDGPMAVIDARTEYIDDGVYQNLWVIRFDADGRAASFIEWWTVSADSPEH